MQTVLITGGTGMVGQSLTDTLLEQGYEVIVLTRAPRKSSRLHLSYAQWDIQKKRWVKESTPKFRIDRNKKKNDKRTKNR
jgi:nucleoside-diphosphate-sugar epimerase